MCDIRIQRKHYRLKNGAEVEWTRESVLGDDLVYGVLAEEMA